MIQTLKIMLVVSSTKNAAVIISTTQLLLSAGVSTIRLDSNTGSSVTLGDIGSVRLDISELRSVESAISISFSILRLIEQQFINGR